MKKFLILALVMGFAGLASAQEICVVFDPAGAGVGDDVTLTCFVDGVEEDVRHLNIWDVTMEDWDAGADSVITITQAMLDGNSFCHIEYGEDWIAFNSEENGDLWFVDVVADGGFSEDGAPCEEGGGGPEPTGGPAIGSSAYFVEDGGELTLTALGGTDPYAWTMPAGAVAEGGVVDEQELVLTTVVAGTYTCTYGDAKAEESITIGDDQILDPAETVPAIGLIGLGLLLGAGALGGALRARKH